MKYLALLALFFIACSQERSAVSPRVNHVMLHVSDLDRSIAFYEQAVGLQLTKRISELTFQPEGGEQATVKVTMALMKFPDQDFVYELAQVPTSDSTVVGYGFQHVGFDVKDIESASEQVVSAGAEQLAPIRLVTAPGVTAKNAFYRGPDGELIELMQLLSGEF